MVLHLVGLFQVNAEQISLLVEEIDVLAPKSSSTLIAIMTSALMSIHCRKHPTVK